MNKLTVDEADRVALMGMGGDSHDNMRMVAKQLADTMRENERLKREIILLRLTHDSLQRHKHTSQKKCPECGGEMKAEGMQFCTKCL